MCFTTERFITDYFIHAGQSSDAASPEKFDEISKMFTLFRYVLFTLIIPAGILATGSAQAAERVVIRFADIGSIRDWHAENSEELFVQNLNKQWYRITFAPPCQKLPFAIGISFEPDNLGNIDKDSSIVVDGERCFFKTIEETVAPITETEKEE